MSATHPAEPRDRHAAAPQQRLLVRRDPADVADESLLEVEPLDGLGAYRRMLAAMEERPPIAFMSWRDLVITPLVWFGLLALAVVATFFIGPDGWLIPLVFYAVLAALTFAALKVMRMAWPLPEGTYRASTHARELYRYNLYSFLIITFLFPVFLNPLIPPPFRKLFYRLTGTRFGKGIISIGGRIADPHHLVTVEEGAIIGDDALILPHAIVLHPEHTVILRRVHIAAGAVVGAKSVVMPGVHVGERATIKAMSLVPTNTVIPAGEVWGGVPAVPQPSASDLRAERAQHAL
jgi:acetyltransferase-like isoleucine patch superfamily enzyme